ncbi:hypothetical protein Droror1_Dr00016756 [Drosera rotundifolia]
MSIESGTFETLSPSRYISFTIPNLLSPEFASYLHSHLLRLAVLDSPKPIQSGGPPLVAAILVPKGREEDWLFSTEEGQLQLISSDCGVSRLVLIGNELERSGGGGDDGWGGGRVYRRWECEDDSYVDRLEERIGALLMWLSPKGNSDSGYCDVRFLRYEDDVIGSVVVERCSGKLVGEMVVEDVEIEGTEMSKREFRRRLRFKRMPNLVQSQIRIVPNVCNGGGLGLKECIIGDLGFRLDLGTLVHPYLAPMVAGLSLIGRHLSEKFESGMRPRSLCCGVGGGALLMFLVNQCGFEVVGVEMDEVVLSVARQYFGLESSELVQICVGDVIEILKNLDFFGIVPRSRSMVGHNDSPIDPLAEFSGGFDAIFVDLDSHVCTTGVTAPPLEFMQRDVLVATKLSLSKTGIVILNVMSPNRSFYEMLLHELQAVFEELYEIDTGNGENYVVIATKSPLPPASRDFKIPFVTKLNLGASGVFLNSIRKI